MVNSLNNIEAMDIDQQVPCRKSDFELELHEFPIGRQTQLPLRYNKFKDLNQVDIEAYRGLMNQSDEWVQSIDWSLPTSQDQLQSQNEKLDLVEFYDLFETKAETEAALIVTGSVKELRNVQL